MKIAASIVIPAYNEEKGISSTIKGIRNILDKSGFIYEIIVVDDGSKDSTAREASSTGVRLISLEYNHGYGAAIKMGAKHAKYDIILITDADATYPDKDIPAILDLMENYDMVVGARVGKKVDTSFCRSAMKWILKKLANYLTGCSIVDLNSGLRAMRKEVFNRFMNILPDGFSLTTTITIAMLTNNYRVKYVPIDYYRRVGRSKFKPVRDTLIFLQLIVRTSMLFNPLKVFIPASIFLFFSGIAVFFYSFFFMTYVMDTTAVVLFVGGVQMLAIGMIADLIDKRL